jgi:HK97 gp10 family phage protein
MIKLDTRELDRITKDCGMNAAKVINRLAFQVEARAKMFAPVDTGAMRNSGFTEAATDENQTATVGFTVEYAPFVEFGTRFQGAQPFLTPAVETIISQFNAGETWREVVK